MNYLYGAFGAVTQYFRHENPSADPQESAASDSAEPLSLSTPAPEQSPAPVQESASQVAVAIHDEAGSVIETTPPLPLPDKNQELVQNLLTPSAASLQASLQRPKPVDDNPAAAATESVAKQDESACRVGSEVKVDDAKQKAEVATPTLLSAVDASIAALHPISVPDTRFDELIAKSIDGEAEGAKPKKFRIIGSVSAEPTPEKMERAAKKQRSRLEQDNGNRLKKLENKLAKLTNAKNPNAYKVSVIQAKISSLQDKK